jgi:EAL domain-containing protein (putative c-di-GMP-specific phosphodiesterase class I)
VLFPENRESLDDLLKHADRAMYQSKFAGRNTIRHYRQATTTPLDLRLTLEQGLRAALEKGELCVYFQPQMSAVSGEVIGAEALLRWQHPRHGLLYPDKFLPLAQETNLIVPIGQWMMDVTLAHATVWETNGLPGCFQGVSVNVSPRQFCWPDFIPYVARLLEKYRLERVTLNLEITEGIVMGDLEVKVEKMRRLKELGVTLSVQDFGTGYSSLASLSRLPLDQLKIDAVFVAGIGVDQPSVAIVESILALARNLELGVVAEGVESRYQLAFLRARGCDVYQGCYARPPMPAREFQRLLAAKHGGAGMPSGLRGQGIGRDGTKCPQTATRNSKGW